MKFDPEYIKLCKNPLIQGLRDKLKKGDWYRAENEEITLTHYGLGTILAGVAYIWLPTGDQLDDEIKKKACGDWYMVDFRKDHYGKWGCHVEDYSNTAMVIIHEEDDSNPLIAKIKLLIQLLKESK